MNVFKINYNCLFINYEHAYEDLCFLECKNGVKCRNGPLSILKLHLGLIVKGKFDTEKVIA